MEKRKAKINKSVSRTIRTADYENVVIKTDLELEIEWTNPEELLHKSQSVCKLLLKDYKETEKATMEELNLLEKKAFPNEVLKNKLGGVAKTENSSSLKEDFDSLD